MASMVRNLVAGMSAREKRMAAGMIVAVGGFAIFLVVFFVSSSIGDLETENAARAQTLTFLEMKKADYLEWKRSEDSREKQGMVKPTPLRTLVDGVVKKVDVPDPDTKELSDQHHGNQWIEHGVEVSIRNVGLEKLTRFMEEVEGNRRRFPIAINKLEIRSRRRAADSYDVKMTISTYEKSQEPEPSSKGKAKKPVRKGAK